MRQICIFKEGTSSTLLLQSQMTVYMAPWPKSLYGVNISDLDAQRWQIYCQVAQNTASLHCFVQRAMDSLSLRALLQILSGLGQHWSLCSHC